VVLVDQPADGGPAVDPGIHPMTERQNIALAGIAVSDLGINCPDPSHRRRFFTSSTPEDADSADLKAGASASRTERLVTHDQKITQALEGLNQVPRNSRLEPVKIKQDTRVDSDHCLAESRVEFSRGGDLVANKYL
jgi:hypothetical protein